MSTHARRTTSRLRKGSRTSTRPAMPTRSEKTGSEHTELAPLVLSPDALYTPEEVGRFLKIPHRTLERWRGLGRGPKFINVGRRPRYLGRAVSEFVKDLGAAQSNTHQ
jgi:hypothetical protein